MALNEKRFSVTEKKALIESGRAYALADWNLAGTPEPRAAKPRKPRAPAKPRPKTEGRPLPADVKAVLVQVNATATSQTMVARELSVSTAVISQLLNDKYTGDVVVMAARIKGAYMGAVVPCPVYGTLAKNKCLEFQALPAAFTNPLRSRLAQRCPTCPHNRKTGKELS